MVEEAVKSYRVAYERDESGWWVATVRGVGGCHTQGRTVDEARRRIREALELFVDNARRAPIVDDVKRRGLRRGQFEPTRFFARRPTKKTGGQPAPLDAPSAYCEPED
jgi:predicted RNase H-like HicB family nuclease